MIVNLLVLHFFFMKSSFYILDSSLGRHRIFVGMSHLMHCYRSIFQAFSELPGLLGSSSTVSDALPVCRCCL